MSETSSASAPKKNKPKLNSLFIGVALAAAVLLLVASVFFLLRTTRVVEPAALVIGESEVSQELYDEYVALGKKQGLAKKDVQDIVVEYEKNKLMAEKYDIAMPSEYVEEVGAVMTIDVLRQQTDASEDDILSAAQRYNKAFLARISQSNQDGYGVFVYDVPAIKKSTETTEEQAIEAAKKVVGEFREKIVKDDTLAAEVLSEVSAFNADNGLAAQSGATFIVDEEFPYDTAESKSVSSNAYILSLVKDKPIGLTDVLVSGDKSAFFIDILYHQKKVENLAYDVQEAKDKTKVVVYDK